MDANHAHRYLESEWERLLVTRAAVEEAHLRDDAESSLGELSSHDQHPADVASEVFEREKEMSIRAQVEADLDAVREAFVRVDAGTYGTCETCAAPIPDERLAAVPATRFCVDHERLWELHTLSVPLPGGTYLDTASAEDLAAREATRHFEFLPSDDVLPASDVGPEEAALHSMEIDGQSAARMGAAEVELAEFVESDLRGSA